SLFTEEVNVLTIDLHGHGHDQSNQNYTWCFKFICEEINHTLSLFNTYQLFLHGYSMGGRIALYYALYGAYKLNGLILESTSPGIKKEEDRIERIQVDQARAKVLEIAGLEIFVNDWEKLPLFQTQYESDETVASANAFSKSIARLWNWTNAQFMAKNKGYKRVHMYPCRCFR